MEGDIRAWKWRVVAFKVAWIEVEGRRRSTEPGEGVSASMKEAEL